VGRVQLHPLPLFEHRREILRAIRADAYVHTHGYSNSDAFADGNCDPNSYSTSKSYTNGNCNLHSNGYAETFTDTEV
jgi:hypothetical protein